VNKTFVLKCVSRNLIISAEKRKGHGSAHSAARQQIPQFHSKFCGLPKTVFPTDKL